MMLDKKLCSKTFFGTSNHVSYIFLQHLYKQINLVVLVYFIVCFEKDQTQVRGEIYKETMVLILIYRGKSQ